MSKLFDVTSQATLQDCMTENNGAEVRVAWGSGIVGHVAQSGCPLNIPEAYEVSVYLSLCFCIMKSLVQVRIPICVGFLCQECFKPHCIKVCIYRYGHFVQMSI